MLSFLAANWGTLLVAALVLLVVVLILAKLLSNRKKGKSPCGCDCGQCSSCGVCRKP